MLQPINPIFPCEWLLLPLYPVPYTIDSAGTNIPVFISCTNNFPCELILSLRETDSFYFFWVEKEVRNIKKHTLA